MIALFLTLICSGTSFSQHSGPRDDPIVIQIIELDHADAEELAKVLQPFLSKDGRVTAYDPGNILIIKDRKSIVAELVKVIKGRWGNGD
jgi:type II secretory pathway component GspD/PulD (secretin)